MKKINSEVKFCDNNFKIKIGTTDKKNHNSIYIELGTYIMPNEVKNTYNSEIEDFEKIIKRFVKDNITQNNDFIIIIDIANDRISINKKSYLEIQIFLKLKDGESQTFKDVSLNMYNNYVRDLISYINNDLYKRGFLCYKTKK